MIGFWRNRLYQLPCCSFFHHKRSTAPRIQIPFGKLFAEAEHSDLYAAINALEQKLERQIIRHIHRPDARRNRQVQRQSSMAAMF